MNYTKIQDDIKDSVFNKFRFSENDIQVFPDGVRALTESGVMKLINSLPSKVMAFDEMVEALKDTQFWFAQVRACIPAHNAHDRTLGAINEALEHCKE